ncbi:MAG: pyrimidine dimer DNA glycosylase/endonuclease V [Syntrophobacteraceae bacterium]
MRIWTLHPKYLDAKGLVSVWREALLAQAVLGGKTRGYRNHPQLLRFKAQDNPSAAIGAYLKCVYEEAVRRGYRFDCSRIADKSIPEPISVSVGQLLFEWNHLIEKLKTRDYARYERLRVLSEPEPHPLFHIVEGGVESWEMKP